MSTNAFSAYFYAENNLKHHSRDIDPKELSVIIVKIKGRDNTFKDVTVRREKVHNVLLWLIHNNPHYFELEVNEMR